MVDTNDDWETVVNLHAPNENFLKNFSHQLGKSNVILMRHATSDMNEQLTSDLK